MTRFAGRLAVRVVVLGADSPAEIRGATLLPADPGDSKEIIIQVEGIVGRMLCGQ